MDRDASPGEDGRALIAGLTERLALLALCSAYLLGGITKVAGFGAAVAEVATYGIAPAAPVAGLIVLTELVAPLLVISGRQRALGAAWLFIFTLIVTFEMNPFWAVPSPERAAMLTAFLERIGLAGAFLYVALKEIARLHMKRVAVPGAAGDSGS